VPAITTTIDREQREGLYELIRNHLGSIEDFWVALERTLDFAKAEQLGLEFAQDFRLLQDIGWSQKDGRESFELTMLADELARALKRLRDEAQGGLAGAGEERKAVEDFEEVVHDLERGRDACDEVLEAIEPRRRARSSSRSAPLPEATPPDINHSVVTGTLSSEPEEARSPTGEPVALLRIEFPVADPLHRKTLWSWASCLVEVPGGCARRDVEGLHGGTAVLVAGQLSDRWMIENGHTSRRGVIVASLVQAGVPAHDRDEL
jgi:hypothetical protein